MTPGRGMTMKCLVVGQDGLPAGVSTRLTATDRADYSAVTNVPSEKSIHDRP